MTRRRSFGSVAKLPSGRWRARYRINGAWNNAPRTFPTKAAASAWLSQTEADILRGDWVDPRRAKITVGEFAKVWMASRKHLAPNTQYNDRYLVEKLILPTFGETAISDIDLRSLMRWRNKLLGQVGNNTAARAYGKLRAMVDDAVHAGYVRSNPVYIRGASVESERVITVATPQEVLALGDAIDPRYRAMVFVGAGGSLRWGECAGLRRANVNDNLLEVWAQDAETAGHFHRRAPKTRAGMRTVVLPQFAADALAEHLEQWVEQPPESLVFTSPMGKHLYSANWRRYFWYPALRKVGLPQRFRFHDLRHTGSTLAASAGVPLRDLQAHLGHSSPRAALRYQHMVAGSTRVADALDSVFGRVTDVSQPVHDQ